jgi:hypothetical protein
LANSIENEHVFKAIFDVDENVAPFILKNWMLMCLYFFKF